jgi:cytochrome c551/c552
MGTDDPLDPMLGDALSRLRDAHPDRDLWPHIARQLEPRIPRGTMMLRWPTALAAGLAIAIATSVSTAVLLHRVGGADRTVAFNRTVEPALSTVAASFAPADAALARAVDDLEKAVRGSLGELDPEARTTVTKTLTMLDAAIAQAAERQIASPDDPRAAKYLTSTLRKKLQLLRTVSELTQRQS